MAVVKFDPPSLEILAIMSVFNVGVSTFSSKTTILLVVGTLPAAKALDIIVDYPPPGEANVAVVPVIITYPGKPSW